MDRNSTRTLPKRGPNAAKAGHSTLEWISEEGTEVFFNKLGYSYSITYVDRPAEHLLPRRIEPRKGIKDLRTERESIRNRARPSNSELSDAVGITQPVEKLPL